jgi:hypothetical protein
VLVGLATAAAVVLLGVLGAVGLQATEHPAGHGGYSALAPRVG